MIKRRRLVVLFILVALFVMFMNESARYSYCSDVRRKIDLFTSKVQFDGKGINQSSDAFQPQELVRLYALVTYNDAPIPNMLVAFQVNNQVNTFLNMTIIGVNWTDYDGVATFSFRIPWPSEDAEQIIFGKWFAVATVDIGGEVVMDTLTFQVGWLLQVTNMDILNGEHLQQTNFLRGDTIIFNLTIKNIALTPKNAIIAIDAKDSADFPIMHEEKAGVFPPGETVIQIASQISTTAHIGEVTVFATPYTASPEHEGVPYSPPFVSKFNLIVIEKIQYYLTVRTEPLGVAVIHGEGWYDKGTNSTPLVAPDYVLIQEDIRYKFCYWDVDGVPWTGNPITIFMDKNHTATAHYSLQFYLKVISPYGNVSGGGWHDANETAYVSLDVGVINHGNGTRRVFTSWSGDASGENYTESNPIFIDEPKTVFANWKTQYLLTVGVYPVNLSQRPMRNPAGEETNVANCWWYDVDVNVSLFAPPISGYDFNYWEVDGIARTAGVYQITVCMDAPHVANAYYSSRITGWFIPEWFYWLLLLVLILLISLLSVFAYRKIRRKSKTEKEAFYRGWTAWYYGYDLRGKIRKS
ncbi:hypothetical protein KEJ45_06230 [Candidatus Bathyarchaeota archaeon]|nr:hypothetical protein [Candidatus Bathyarchaeota archaeon]